MADRVSMTRTRFAALVGAAMQSPCSCALPEQRQHDGACISCWALRDRIQALRSVVGKPGIGDDYFRRRLAQLEGELRLREEQLPSAEAEVRAARAREEARGLVAEENRHG